MLEPIIFPKDNSGTFFKTASIDTTNSESEVPKPIITIPIIISDNPIFLPNKIEADIKKSAPLTTIISPIMINIKLTPTNIGNSYLS